MSDQGVRVNIYLSREANEKRIQIPNFSAWVDAKLRTEQIAIPETAKQPGEKMLYCPVCKCWYADKKYKYCIQEQDFGQLCNTPLILMERRGL